MANRTVIKILTENNLRVTPQRTAILEVVLSLDTHPTADEIAAYLRLNFPHIPIGTVYKNLELFVNKKIISVVKTYDGFQRFDPLRIYHHHLYTSDSNQIEDFNDEELNRLLHEYFKKIKIPDFIIEDIRLQIIGRYNKNN
jgi:Fur family transcriptional regulator, peroxide stress response regulator